MSQHAIGQIRHGDYDNIYQVYLNRLSCIGSGCDDDDDNEYDDEYDDVVDEWYTTWSTSFVTSIS
jgi:hypothetical protein